MHSKNNGMKLYQNRYDFAFYTEHTKNGIPNTVCNSGTLCAGMEQENLVYTQPNTKSMLDRLSFFKPKRPKLLQIGQTRYQSTPLYLYIQNIKLVCNSGTVCAGMEQENGVYTPLNTKSMLDRLSFFKPKRPNLLQKDLKNIKNGKGYGDGMPKSIETR